MKNQNVFLLALVSILLSCQSQEASNYENNANSEPEAPSIEGAWEIVETAYSDADTSYVYSPYRSVIIYSGNYYSVEIAQRERESWPDLAEGEERACEYYQDAYRGLTSNSGRYEVKGDSIYWDVLIAKSPNFMNDYPKRTNHLVLDGDKMTIKSSRSGGRNYATTYKRL